MTTVGKKILEDELDQLIKVEREKIKHAISEARALGDLKENAEYHSAKEKQALIEGRVGELQHKLANCVCIDVSTLQSDKVVFGATVTLLDVEKDKAVTYQIVGVEEANVKAGKISYKGPMGQALIGKEVGDTVTVKAPKGEIEYELEEIRFGNS